MPDPDKRKLRFVDKIPILPSTIKPPKMQKKLRFMRGPEDVHNFLMHKQYGIMVRICIYDILFEIGVSYLFLS